LIKAGKCKTYYNSFQAFLGGIRRDSTQEERMEKRSEETAGFTVIIQAGGESRRMGMDKGLVQFLGQPLVARVVSRVAMLADEVLVTTNDRQGYRFLDVPLVADLLPERGALGGLYTALSAARYPIVGVVACDMPFASSAILTAQRDLLIEMGADVVIPQMTDGLEPFHAVYRRATCLPAIGAALESGKQRVDSWFPQVKLLYLSQEELRRHDPYERAFFNVNTPEDLSEAERMANQAERD
jgi:molybdopterin-guanine dinucleotide biosynthesis protein A